MDEDELKAQLFKDNTRDNPKTKMSKKAAIEQKILQNKKRDIWTTVLKNSAPGNKKSNAQTNQEEANRMKKR